MRRSLAFALFFFLAAFTARAARRMARGISATRDDGRMQIEMVSDHNQNSHPIERSAFTGLTAAQIDANADTPVDFRMIRDAGTMHFTGTFSARRRRRPLHLRAERVLRRHASQPRRRRERSR